MLLQPQQTERLLASLCEKERTSATQTQHAIIQKMRKRLRKHKLDLRAVNVIGANDLRRNQPERTLELLGQYSPEWQDDAVSSQLAGYAYLAKRDFTEAHQWLDRSIKLDPHRNECWTLLGKISEETGQTEDAIRYYERALVIDETDYESAIALASLYARNHKLRDAIHTLRVCLIRDQRSPQINLVLAKMLQRRAGLLKRKRKFLERERLLHEALRCYETANASAPGPHSLIAQGLLQQKLDLHEQAKSTFQKAVQRSPDSPAALTLLAIAHVDCGELTEAIELFESALQIEPDRASTHFRYSRAQKFRNDRRTKKYIAQLKGLIATPDRKPSDLSQLHFALAKVLEDTQAYEQAWHHYDEANRLKPGHSQSKNSKTSADRVMLETLADESTRFFSPTFFQTFAHVGNPSVQPIFIVGMPRSGTTLTEQILSSHHAISGAGELHLIEHIRHDLMQPESNGRSNRVTAAQPYPSGLWNLPAERYGKAAEFYLRHLSQHCPVDISERQSSTHQPRITDKMPTNFIHLGLIATLLPNATVIHCRRNPMDIFVSSYCQNLSAPFCDLDQLVSYYRSYRRLMHHWESVLPINIHTVDYELLVNDPVTQSRKMIQHCGLPWNERCLDFHKNDRAVHTPSKWQVRQPMYNTSVEKWRRYEKQLRIVTERVQAICDEFDNKTNVANDETVATSLLSTC